MAANSAEKARALEQCERDLDVAIERLVNLRLDAAEHGAHHDDVHPATAAAAAAAEEEEQRTVNVHVPSDGSDDRTDQWIERLMEAMASAENWGDARARAARLLEDFDASVATACRAERDVALWQNGLLKKAVRVQHRLYKEKEAANRELQRQLAGCQERVRSLETDNYALSMYLRNAQPQGGAITGRFHHPEVF
jgi:hypothetical protein